MCSPRRSLLLSVVLALATWLYAGAAEAKFYNPPGKAGPLMFNLKLGAAIGIPGDNNNLGTTLDQFLLQLEFGGAVDSQRQLYLLFPLTFHVGGGCAAVGVFGTCVAVAGRYSTILVPLGVQYDIPIRAVPGLYLYPRGQLGYAAFISRDGFGTNHFGFIAPEFGIKYVLKQRWNFGGEPFSLPIYFNGNGALLNYRLTFYAGVNF